MITATADQQSSLLPDLHQTAQSHLYGAVGGLHAPANKGDLEAKWSYQLRQPLFKNTAMFTLTGRTGCIAASTRETNTAAMMYCKTYIMYCMNWNL